MRAWLRSARRMRGLAFVGLILALAGAFCWGQTFPEEMVGTGEPPMGEPPMSPQPPSSPNSPFKLPAPTPLPPEQAAPFVPAPPFAAGNPGGMSGPNEPAVPMVRLRIQAPARIEPDKEIEYRLLVENVSAAAAHHVLVRDRLPRGLEENVRAEPKFTDRKKTKDDTDLLWDLGTLRPGEQKAIVLTIKPKGSEDIQNFAYVQFEHGQKVTTRIAKPSMRVKVTAPTQAIRYEAVTFRIEIANTGAATLRNVVVTDEVPAGLEFVSGKPEPNGDKPLTWKLGDIPPQQMRHVEYQAIAKQTGTFRNRAKATGAGAAEATDGAAVTVGEAKLKISISAPQRRLANRPIPYRITVGNLGTVPITNVQVSDELPNGGVEFLSADSGGRREGEFLRWSLGNLSPGEQRSFHMVLRSPKAGWCWNEVKVQADHGLSDRARSEATHIDHSPNAPVIEIDKSPDRFVVGQKAIYTIRLFNPGKVDALNPRVFVAVPEEMSITAERGETPGQRRGQNVQFDPVKVLGASEEKVYTIEVVANKAGEAKLRAWWSDGRQDAGPTETWEDKTTIHDPAQTSAFARKAQQTQSRKSREEPCTSPTASLAGY